MEDLLLEMWHEPIPLQLEHIASHHIVLFQSWLFASINSILPVVVLQQFKIFLFLIKYLIRMFYVSWICRVDPSFPVSYCLEKEFSCNFSWYPSFYHYQTRMNWKWKKKWKQQLLLLPLQLLYLQPNLLHVSMCLYCFI